MMGVAFFAVASRLERLAPIAKTLVIHGTGGDSVNIRKCFERLLNLFEEVGICPALFLLLSPYRGGE
jgi:hypothetical protein